MAETSAASQAKLPLQDKVIVFCSHSPPLYRSLVHEELEDVRLLDEDAIEVEKVSICLAAQTTAELPLTAFSGMRLRSEARHGTSRVLLVILTTNSYIILAVSNK